MELGVEAEDAAAEQALEQLVAPRADAEGSAFGQGMCQNVMMVARGSRSRISCGQQGEVVVLHEHDRIVGVHLGADRVGELPVDRLVVLPVLAAEDGPRVGDVAERPEPLVGEAVVVALSSSGVSQTRRSVYDSSPGGTATRPWRSTVSRSAEPLPCATQTPEQARITGSSAVTRPLAGWSTLMLPSAVALVDVRLAVGDDHHPLALQVPRRAPA